MMMMMILTIVTISVTTTTQAYVTNNNGNTGITTTTTPPSFLDGWIPKNAFLPKRHLDDRTQQLVNSVFHVQLDLATQKGEAAAAALETAVTTTLLKTTDSKQHPSPNHPTKKKPVAVKSSLLLQQELSPQTPRLPIRNLQFALLGDGDGDRSSSNNIPMPGVHGRHPLLSSGLFPIEIHNGGEYVTLDRGVQSFVPLSSIRKPVWEVVWKDSSPFGTMVCGMELPTPIRRTAGAMIPAGIMYLSFPVWDAAQLLVYQKKKIQYDLTAKLYAQERDAEMIKMTESSNIFNKMMHYRNAFAAAENYSLQPHKMYGHVPTNCQDLVAIPQDDDQSQQYQHNGPPPPLLYIVPRGQVRIVPTATIQQWSKSSTPCGKQNTGVMMMNHLLWSSSASTNQADHPEILHGTAKMKIVPSPPTPFHSTIDTATKPPPSPPFQ